VLSSPAIGSDGTVYCGSHDEGLYALYPNNGTVKWRFGTGGWVRTAPCIADDGTIYCVSLSNYLFAINPNGTMKWRTNVGAGTSPTIGQDGTIYAGWDRLYAVNPTNGSIKWVFNPGSGLVIEGGTPAHSAEGTIYFGTHSNDDGSGGIIAVNPNGTEKWRSSIGTCDSAPAIGEDGAVYTVTSFEGGGYLHAFGPGPLKAEANGPYKGVANKPVQLTGTIFGGIPPYTCHWDFGDGNISEEQNPAHTYAHMGNFTVTFSVTDSEGNQSSDTSYVIVSAAPPKVTITKPVNGIYFRDIRILPFFRPFLIGAITVQVDATQEPYGIDRVEFYIDGELKTTDTEAPYQWAWSTRAFFKHTIKVIAYDTSGKSTGTSIEVSKFF
jgi:PKD repeat protein